MTLDLRDVEVFLAVVRQNSFGRAATELTITQPAVSERVRHLERVIGTRLFERTTRGAALTPAGELLVPYAQRCVALADEAIEVTRQSEESPRLVIAVHSTFAMRVVPLVLGALAAAPHRVAVRDAHSHEVEALVLDGVADVGFAIPGRARRGLRRVALPPDPVGCFVAPDHELARTRRPPVHALRTALIAVNEWGDGAEPFLTRLHAGGVEAWRIRRCGDAATAVALARDHGHVAFVSASSASAELTVRRLRRVDLAALSSWVVRLELLHRAADRDSDTIQVIRGALC